MIYAFRHYPETGNKVLVEFKSALAMGKENGRLAAAHGYQGMNEKCPVYRRATKEQAHTFVRQGGIHETGLWVNADNRICYARGE